MRFVFPILIALVLFASCQKEEESPIETLFEAVPQEQTGVTFVNEVRNTEQYNIIQYLYYYNGGGVAIGDVNGDALPDLFFSANRLENRLYLNKGDFQFEDVSGSAGITGSGDWKTGVSMVDINADGNLDIYVCQVGEYKRFNGRNELYINQGDGTFQEKAADYGLDFVGFSQQTAWADFDGDGDLDCFLLNHSVHNPANYQSGDVREERDPLAGDRLFRNDGERFTDVSEEMGIYGGRVGFGLGVVVSDFDNNGWPDIYVANDFHENDYLYLNQGNGSFEEGLVSSIGHTSRFSMGVDAGDLNNDGLPDLLSLDMKPEDETVKKKSVGPDPYNIYQFKVNFGYHHQYARNTLQVNQGVLPGAGLQFSEVATATGIAATDWSWSCLFADLDNDGLKDVFITNGILTRPNDLDYLNYISDEEIQESASDVQLISEMPEGIVPNYAFHNRGELQFDPIAAEWGLDLSGCSNGAAYADLDADGDLDLVVNNLNQPASLYRNRSRERGSNFIQLQLKGSSLNPFAYGSKVHLYSEGSEQVVEVHPVRGWQSSVEPLVHFGLGDQAAFDSIVIQWPDRKRQLIRGLPVNQRSVVVWDAALDVTTNDPMESEVFIQQAPDDRGLTVVHAENTFTDFNLEKLLPYELSEEGPCVAAGDVNGDGTSDLYVGASKGQLPKLYVQKESGAFEEMPGLFSECLLLEDADAVFLDVERDGDLDLYVVSGGGEYPDEHEKLEDRLYLNDGNGNFQRSIDQVPTIRHNGSCVVSADFDADGDLDLFVGNHSVPRAYGSFPPSHILLNDGKGVFEDATESLVPELKDLGMVTDAAWSEQDRSLIIVGHWMPVCQVRFSGGEAELSRRDEYGWWNSVHVSDLDGNGHRDVILGNLGWNTDLGRGDKEEPVGLYLSDFDDNTSQDPVLIYYRNGEPVPFQWKDELVLQIVPLKKKFVDYSRYASSTINEIFEPAELEAATYRHADYFSSAIWWDMEEEATLDPFPDPVQWSTVEAITVWDGQIILAGNRDGFSPAIGRQDASLGWVVDVDANDRSLDALYPRYSGLVIDGYTRQLLVVDDLLIAVRNGAALGLFERVE